ncbi:hypothetical protein HK103_004346 [Boothiomyces macroporosus]|uniref:Uncharacterized protein n=1 Tax=Boothiomyces macroporosus TaxID=261099 RepID=A0AAD5UL34_9FUNG|nr:hypothetical protein HK103_004346 [Boothiomyces macroporosus]
MNIPPTNIDQTVRTADIPETLSASTKSQTRVHKSIQILPTQFVKIAPRITPNNAKESRFSSAAATGSVNIQKTISTTAKSRKRTRKATTKTVQILPTKLVRIAPRITLNNLNEQIPIDPESNESRYAQNQTSQPSKIKSRRKCSQCLTNGCMGAYNRARCDEKNILRSNRPINPKK